MIQMTPPKADELEVSLFGPGIGECVVLHLGAGEWAVVDSCLNAAGDRPIAQEYLERIGVDVATQLKSLVVTHWHDDHIRGIAQLFRSATSARFACSMALRCEEFFKLVVAGKAVKFVDKTSGVSEFGQVLDVLEGRRGGRFRAGPDDWACGTMCLYSRSGPYGVTMHALSPSAQTITDTKGQLAKRLPHFNEPIRRFHASGPNAGSVVLLVVAGEVGLLLGGDLERGRDPLRGWQAILRSDTRPSSLGHVYKVAHHGSSNADCQGIWNDLLVNSPVAMLTPYARGVKALPSPPDVERLKSRTARLYCTTWPAKKAPPKRDRSVDRTMREVTRSRWAMHRVSGHVRLRIPMNKQAAGFSIELSNEARLL